MDKKRLINADKLENYIRTNAKVEHDDTQYDIGRVHGLINAAGLIHFAPTIDAVEVVHGRWVEHKDPIPWCEDDADVFYRCSACGLCVPGETNYCPNCGAKMDGE